MQDFKTIVITSGPVVKVSNPTSHPLIGKGSQGAVFRLSPERCVKIYARTENAEREIRAYKAAQGSPILPKLYEYGSNYIVIEFVHGVSLKEYLTAQNAISSEVAGQILRVLSEIKRFGFLRLDWSLRHILIDTNQQLKIIDLGHAFKYKTNRPATLFRELEALGLLLPFLEHVKHLDIKTYVQWKKAMGEYF